MPPGAGQKSATTLAYQSSRRGQVEEIVTPHAWASVIRAMLRQAQQGNVKAATWLQPWVMGAEPKELTVTVDLEARVRALALATGFDPEEAVAEAQRLFALPAGDD
jgi:hypothetical protein